MPNETDEVVLKITSSKEPGYVKSVAGAMGWVLREKGYCKARAVKMDAVNTAIKSVAIVNQRVAQAGGLIFEIDLLFSPTKNDPGMSSTGPCIEATAIAMTVQANESPRPEQFVQYKVSGKKEYDDSLVARLAGAIAAPVREGKGVTLRCIGAAAVYRAVLASTIAKGHICPNGLSAVVIPRWASIEDEGKSVSLIEVDFWGRKTT